MSSQRRVRGPRDSPENSLTRRKNSIDDPTELPSTYFTHQELAAAAVTTASVSQTTSPRSHQPPAHLRTISRQWEADFQAKFEPGVLKVTRSESQSLLAQLEEDSTNGTPPSRTHQRISPNRTDIRPPNGIHIESKEEDEEQLQIPPSSTLSTTNAAAAVAQRFIAASSAAAQALSNESTAAASSIPVPPLSPVRPPAHAMTFTIYKEGYLKQKLLSPDQTKVIRGKSGTKRYYVWHSKGISVWTNESDYRSDQRPVQTFINAWNKKRPSEDQSTEDSELMMIPYTHVNPKTDSVSMLLQAQLDECLMRLVLCPPALLQRLDRLPPSATIMVLKGANLQETKEWLNASSRIHYTRARDKQLHTKILPMLHSLLEDPNGFLMTHAPRSTTPPTQQREEEPPIESNVVLPKSIHTVRDEFFPTFIEPDDDGYLRPIAVRSQPSSPIAQPQPISVRPKPLPQFLLPTLNMEPLPTVHEIESVSVTPAPTHLGVEIPEMNMGDMIDMLRTRTSTPEPVLTPRLSNHENLSSHEEEVQKEDDVTSLQPTTHSVIITTPSAELQISPNPAIPISPWSPRATRPVSSNKPSSTTIEHAPTNTCEFYGLNGETPLFPTLPLADISRYNTHSATTASSASSTSINSRSVLSLDLLGPRRCTVYDLLQWILFQFPGSNFQLPMEATANLLSPRSVTSSPLSPSMPSSPDLWSPIHIQFAFLLFRGAYIECDQLLEWMKEFWHSSNSSISPHQLHHLRGNILFFLLIWIEHFRCDYLQVKLAMDRFLLEIYQEMIEFESHSSDPSPTCSDWTSGQPSSTQPRCINLTALAAQLSNIIALTSGTTTSVLSSMLAIPPAYLAIAAPTTRPINSDADYSSLENDAAANDSRSSIVLPRPMLTRTASSPLLRRQSFIVRSSIIGSSSSSSSILSIVDDHPLSKSVPPLSSPNVSGPPVVVTNNFGSQAHRPPQPFAHRMSTLIFLKKFVGFSAIATGKGLLEYSPQAVAAELTNMDLESMQCIYLRELTHKSWTLRPHAIRTAQAGSVLNFIESFNRRSFWVASEILKAGSEMVPNVQDSLEMAHSARLEMLIHFISILHELSLLSNFYGCFAIINGLNLNPLFRLQKLWDSLPLASTKLLASLRSSFSNETNSSAYRQRVRETILPKQLAHIPHFAILLKDLFQLEELDTWVKIDQELDPTSPPPQLLNWSKYAKQYLELHNSFLLPQNFLAYYERVQMLKERSEVQQNGVSSPKVTSNGVNHLSAAPSTPTKVRRSSTVGSINPAIATSALIRPPLPPSDPTLRMWLHLALQRVYTEEKLYQLSYRCQPKSK